MNPFIQDHFVVDQPAGATPAPRWICVLGVLHSIVCAVGLTINLL